MATDPMRKLSAKDTKNDRKKTILINGRLIDFSTPKVMGIVNLTPDSFYDGGATFSVDSALAQVNQMVADGADMIDLGAQSTRPGAPQVGATEEWNRMENSLKQIIATHPDLIISIDTYHSEVAAKAIGAGAHIVNDISAGSLDENMFSTVAKLQVPYVLMHMRGTPENMQQNPTYADVVTEVTQELASKAATLRDLGVNDILIDPGFGFGKTVEHNFDLLENLEHLAQIGHPLFIGLSRKSMIWKTLNTTPDKALTGTIALNFAALERGAAILRVHDVKEAVEVRTLWQKLKSMDNHL